MGFGMGPVMKAIITALVLMASVMAPKAFAGRMTTADLISICGGSEEVTQNACKFYILGVTEGTSLAAGLAADKGHFCIPEGVTATEMVLVFRRVVQQDIRAFPADLEMPAVSMVGAIMQREYPCRGMK